MALELPEHGVGLGGEVEELGDDLIEVLGVVHPFAIALDLMVGEVPRDGLAGHLGGPLPVGSVEAGGIGVAGAAGGAAAGEAFQDGATENEAEIGEFLGLLVGVSPQTCELAFLVGGHGEHRGDGG